MSIFQTSLLTCPDCGARTQVERCASVNADRRPDLRRAILDGTFQATACSGCGTRLRLPPHFTYLETGRALWIAVEPAEEIETWPAHEASVFKVYHRSFGLDAAPVAQELGEGLLPRLVFGWAALREKLVCDALGLDDVTLELLKMAVIRTVDRSPLADQSELRLIAGDATTLNLHWVAAETEATLAALDVPRAVYEAIAAEPEPWAEARAKFDHVFLVDLRRLITGPATAAAA